jgi:NADH:ubiquinone oxidoreductase subunit H
MILNFLSYKLFITVINEIYFKFFLFIFKDAILSIFFVAINVIFLIIIILATAYVTLFERKILASVHHRKGPNNVGF